MYVYTKINQTLFRNCSNCANPKVMEKKKGQIFNLPLQNIYSYHMFGLFCCLWAQNLNVEPYETFLLYLFNLKWLDYKELSFVFCVKTEKDCLRNSPRITDITHFCFRYSLLGKTVTARYYIPRSQRLQYNFPSL